MANAFLIAALVFVGTWIVFSIMIVNEVSKRGTKINFFLLRLYIIKYIQQYKQITRQEAGKVGPLYYPCVVSVNLAWIFALVGFILK
jgi:hypothetical protein